MKTKRTLNRRDFIGMTIAGSATLLIQGCPNSMTDQSNTICSNPTADQSDIKIAALPKIRTRYAIDDPYKDAKRNADYYRKAVKRMKDISLCEPENKMGWYAQARIHYEYCGSKKDVHEKPIFLPWHRAYLVYFEEICRKILSDLQVPDFDEFALPYWDWSKSPYIPEIFWDKSRNDWDEDLNSINPDSWKLTAGCERNDVWNTKCDGVDQSIVDDLMTKDFRSVIGGVVLGSYYTGELEIHIHRRIHGFIGGNMFNSPAAALDPIFWLHHANVDRILERWMKIHEKEIPHPNCPASDNDCCNNCAAKSNEKDKQICFKQSAQICNWLRTEITGFPLTIENINKIKVCNLLNTLDLGYKYNGTEEIHFGDCLNLKTVNEDDFSIGKNFDDKKAANITNPVTINTEELENLQNLQRIKKALSQILTTKITLDTPSASPSLLLTLEVKKPENPATSVRIFINPPINPLELSIDSPSYAATFSFFESLDETHHHDNGNMNEHNESRRFIFDITSTILRLESFDLATAKVFICPIFLNGQEGDSMGNISLSSLHLLLAQ